IAPALFESDGGITIGPIPKGLPINLLANLRPISESEDPVERLTHAARVAKLLIRLKLDFASLPDKPTDEEVKAKFSDLVPTLLDLNKCPDFVVNRGHYFGTDLFGEEPGLSDEQ